MSRELADDEGTRKYTYFLVKPYRTKELAAVYHLPIRTFQRWLKRIRNKIGKVEGHFLTIHQVELVIQHYSLPFYIKVEITDEDEVEKGRRNKPKSTE